MMFGVSSDFRSFVVEVDWSSNVLGGVFLFSPSKPLNCNSWIFGFMQISSWVLLCRVLHLPLLKQYNIVADKVPTTAMIITPSVTSTAAVNAVDSGG